MKRNKPHQYLAREVHRLSKTILKLQREKPFDVMTHPGRFMWLAFLKGIMIGFGSFLGATLLVAMLLYLLSKIQLIPIVGDFVQKVIEEMNAGKS